MYQPDPFTQFAGLTPSEIAASLAASGIRGKRGDGNRCPIALATGCDYVGTTEAVPSWDRPPIFWVPVPENVRAFISGFDAGDWPELIERPS